jgi:hypothetical protein
VQNTSLAPVPERAGSITRAQGGRYRTVTTHLTKAERYMADVTEDVLNKVSADALANQAGHSKMGAFTAAPADLSTRAGFTVYTGH